MSNTTKSQLENLEEFIHDNWDSFWSNRIERFIPGTYETLKKYYPSLTPYQIKYRLHKARTSYMEGGQTEQEPATGFETLSFESMREDVAQHEAPKITIPEAPQLSYEDQPVAAEDMSMYPEPTHEGRETGNIPETVHDLITSVYADKSEGEALNPTEVRLMACAAELMFIVERQESEIAQLTRR